MGLGGPGLILLSPSCPSSLGEVLALGLRAFLELMEHGVVSWETLSIPFVRKVGGLFWGQQVEVVGGEPGSGLPWWCHPSPRW